MAGDERGRGRVTASSSAAAFALSIWGRSGKADTWGAEMVSEGYFYAFLAVTAVSDHGGKGGLSITSSSPFSSGVALVPLLLYFSIHLHELWATWEKRKQISQVLPPYFALLCRLPWQASVKEAQHGWKELGAFQLRPIWEPWALLKMLTEIKSQTEFISVNPGRNQQHPEKGFVNLLAMLTTQETSYLISGSSQHPHAAPSFPWHLGTWSLKWQLHTSIWS